MGSTTWSPMYDLINVFEVFLPQLLRYPNPTDPLNGEAAALLMREPKTYEYKVAGAFPFTLCTTAQGSLADGRMSAEYVKKYATKEAADQAGAPEDEEDEDEDMSDVGSMSDADEVRSHPHYY